MSRQIEHRLEIIVRQPEGRQQPHPLLFVHGAYSGAWCWDEYFLPYFAKISLTFSIGIDSIVRPFPVTVVALSRELMIASSVASMTA